MSTTQMRYFTNKLNALLENEFDFLDTDAPVQDGEDNFTGGVCCRCDGIISTDDLTCPVCNLEYCYDCIYKGAVVINRNGCTDCCPPEELYGYEDEEEYDEGITENEFDFLDADEPVQDGKDNFGTCACCGARNEDGLFQQGFWSSFRGCGKCSNLYCELCRRASVYLTDHGCSMCCSEEELNAHDEDEYDEPLREDEFDFLDTDEPVRDGEDDFGDELEKFEKLLGGIRPRLMSRRNPTFSSDQNQIAYYTPDEHSHNSRGRHVHTPGVDVSNRVRSHPLYAGERFEVSPSHLFSIDVVTNVTETGSDSAWTAMFTWNDDRQRWVFDWQDLNGSKWSSGGSWNQ